MRILLATAFPLSEIGGVTTSVLRLHEQLVALGHTVVLFVDGQAREFRQVGDYEGSPVYGAYLRAPYVSEAPIKGAIAFCVKLPVTLWRLYTLLAAHHVEVVHCCYPLPWVLYFALLRPFSRWRLVVTYLGNDVHDIPTCHWSAKFITRLLLRSTDSVVCVSQSLVGELRVLTRTSVDVHMIPTGTPLESGLRNVPDTVPSIPDRYIITAGHLIHRKGVDVALRAMALAPPSRGSLPLVVVGDGPERESLEQLARDLGIADRVHFLGSQTHNDVLALVAGALAFVLTSRAEGLPLVILEAMAAHVPVIATNVDGIPEVVQHRHTGLLVPPDDPAALCDALQEYRSSPELRAAVADAAYRQVEQSFTWSSVARRYERLYEGDHPS